MKYKSIIVQLPEGPSYLALTDGAKWNGWECPWLTFEVCMTVIKDWNDVTYSSYHDAFIEKLEVDDNETVIYRAKVIDGTKYYPLGRYYWCWDEVFHIITDGD